MKKPTETSVKVGDWVRMYDQGIWQVYRVLVEVKAWDPIESRGKRKVMVFGKRLINNAFKRSFSEGCCHISLIRQLSKEDRKRLQEFIAENARVYEQFVEYRPKPVDAIFNANISIPDDKNRSRLEA